MNFVAVVPTTRPYHGSGEAEEALSLHPAEIRADRLASELEESRVLREKDKVRYEIMLREGEGEKGKLRRQVIAHRASASLYVCIEWMDNRRRLVKYEVRPNVLILFMRIFPKISF